MLQTIIAIVENKPGVLNRVASLFRRRSFNIDSLNVGRTENPLLSRMTIVVDSQNTEASRVESNLYKLVNVVDVQDVTGTNAIMRELALIKVHATPVQRSEIVSLSQIFHATVEDVTDDTLIVQISASGERVDSIVETLKPFGIMEMVRTGDVAMMRGDVAGVRHTPGAGEMNSQTYGNNGVSAD